MRAVREKKFGDVEDPNVDDLQLPSHAESAPLWAHPGPEKTQNRFDAVS